MGRGTTARRKKNVGAGAAASFGREYGENSQFISPNMSPFVLHSEIQMISRASASSTAIGRYRVVHSTLTRTIAHAVMSAETKTVMAFRCVRSHTNGVWRERTERTERTVNSTQNT